MGYNDKLSTTNFQRYHARELTKAIRSMSPESREDLAMRILFKKPLMDRNVELATHVVALLQDRRPRTSLEKLLREGQLMKQQGVVDIFLLEAQPC